MADHNRTIGSIARGPSDPVAAASAVLPPVCELNAQVSAVMSAYSCNHIAYVEIDGLEAERKLRSEFPFHVGLSIGPRIESGLAGGAWHRDVRNRIDCIGSRLDRKSVV